MTSVEINNILREQGKTPFDLLSWEVLLKLRYDFKPIDVIHTHFIIEEMDNALRRKVAALDKDHNTDFYTKTLEAWDKASK